MICNFFTDSNEFFSIPCGEATSVEGGGPINEGSTGTVRVPGTNNPEMLIRVNACTSEVQNCRHQHNETSETQVNM